jgi:hypothetical protein
VVIAIVVAALAGGGCSLVCLGYLGYRRAQLSTIRQLVEIRARLPQFHEDSLVFSAKDTPRRIVFRAWFDGAELAILHEESYGWPEHGRQRLYLANGAVLACSSSFHRSEGAPRDQESAILYDPSGIPLTGWVQQDGRRRSPSRRKLVTYRQIEERIVREFMADYLEPNPTPSPDPTGRR